MTVVNMRLNDVTANRETKECKAYLETLLVVTIVAMKLRLGPPEAYIASDWLELALARSGGPHTRLRTSL